MAIDQSVINFAVYEDSVEYLGMSKATLPDVTFLTQSISGAGVGGNVEAVILGHLEAMTLGLEFRTTTPQSVRLSELRRHSIDLRVANQYEDPVSGVVEARKEKHILVVEPKSTKGGTIAPATPTSGSGEYAVRYWATYINGKKGVSWTPSTSSATSTVWIIWPVSVRPWASNPHMPFRRSCILQPRPIF